MSDEMDLEERLVDVVKASGSEVVAKPLGVEEYQGLAKATEEEKAKALRENEVGDWSEGDAGPVGDDEVGVRSGN